MRPNLEIAGLGHALPQRIVDNDEVARVIDTSDAFIRTRTGVRHRRYLAPGQQLADLACPAAERAMAEAGVAPADIDLLIVNTLSPDHHDPSQACYMQPRLGLREIPCFDIRAQCSGGLYGIEIARHFVASGLYRNVLLICAEALSRRIDTSNAGRNLSILLSDGAAAMVLRAQPDATRGLIDLALGADGTQFDLLCSEAPGAKRPNFIDADDIAPAAITSACGARTCSRTRRAASSTRAGGCSTSIGSRSATSGSSCRISRTCGSSTR